MQIIKLRDIIRDAPSRWMKQYSLSADHAPLSWNGAETYGDVRRRLSALDLETCSQADIERAIGRPDWASLICDECQFEREHVIRIGQEPDYEARWQDLCAECIQKAAKMLLLRDAG